MNPDSEIHLNWKGLKNSPILGEFMRMDACPKNLKGASGCL